MKLINIGFGNLVSAGRVVAETVFSISGWALRKALTTLSFPVPAAPETTNRYFSFSMVLLLLFCHCFALGLTGGTAGHRFGLKG